MLSNTHFSMAIHVLSALAYHEGEVVGSDTLAMSVGTNPSFLRGLIGRLKEAGLVTTQMGKGGGTRLARKASKISLRDVYLATESRPALTTHDCCIKSKCPVQAGMRSLLSDINERVEKAVASELKRTTVADLLSNYIDSRP
jgi:Rrf2 family protein